MKRVDWNKAESLIFDGFSDEDVADRVGCHRHTIKMRRLKLGITNSRNLDYELVDALIYIGEPDKDIADYMGCQENTIALRRRNLGIRKRSYREYASSLRGVRYYPDVINAIKRSICREVGIDEADFKEFVDNNADYVEQWNRRVGCRTL